MRKSKGAFQFLWLLGGVLLVVAPMVVGFLITGLFNEMHPVVYAIVGYALLFVLDFFIISGIMKLPSNITLAVSSILPFVQAGILTLVMGSI